MTNVADETLGKIARQQNDLFRRVREGSLDSIAVGWALQQIIEGKSLMTVPDKLIVQTSGPSWYVLPEQQLERVKQLNVERGWGFTEEDFPEIPANFTGRSATEVLLLCVYLPKRGRQPGLQRTFDELWRLITAPDGYTKYRWEELKSDSKHLRSAPGHSHRAGIRWVSFDPNAYHGKSPEFALARRNEDNIRLAGVEVLMAALLFPTWMTSWNGTDSPYLNLSGLQFYWESDWSSVPCLDRWDGHRQVKLYAYWAAYAHDSWSSPVVREC